MTLARPVPLGRRSVAVLTLTSAVGLAAFGWPLLASTSSALVGHSADAPWLFALLLPLLLAVLVAQISESGLDPKAVALLGVLAAAGAALRPLGAGTAGLEPMFFLMVLAGRVLGPGFGFVLGALSMFASSLLTGGVGPGCRSRCSAWAGSASAPACSRERPPCAAAANSYSWPATARSPPSSTAQS